MNTPTNKSSAPQGSFVGRNSGMRRLANESYEDERARLIAKIKHINLFGTLPEFPSTNLLTKERAVATELIIVRVRILDAEASERATVSECSHPEPFILHKSETIANGISAKDTISHTCAICGTRWRTILGDA